MLQQALGTAFGNSAAFEQALGAALGDAAAFDQSIRAALGDMTDLDQAVRAALGDSGRAADLLQFGEWRLFVTRQGESAEAQGGKDQAGNQLLVHLGSPRRSRKVATEHMVLRRRRDKS
ncbi:hypothetical protein ACE3ME_04330 [Pseudomonas alcaligenes]|uniref:hypothetical protein n=1 Tax=Aquipseudomonas alcaligenes TaxID=43263 RepID=UPI0036533D99